MQQTNNEKRNLIIEELCNIKKIKIDQAKELLATLETYCELIINYTLKNTDEQSQKRL